MMRSQALVLCLAVLFCAATADLNAERYDELGRIHLSPGIKEIDASAVGHLPTRKLLQSASPNELLMAAIAKSDQSAVQQALDQGADPNHITPDKGLIPLVAAVVVDNPEIIKILVKRGATVDSRDRQGLTALEAAAIRGNFGSLKALLEAGADPNNEDSEGLTPVHRASIEGHVDIVEALVSAGGDYERRTGESRGRTALHIAANNGHLQLVKLLIGLGADVNAKSTQYNHTPLHYAASDNSGVIIQELVNAGADVNALTTVGDTPLIIAAYFGNSLAIETLLDAGARKDLTENNGFTARRTLCQCIFAADTSERCKVEACDSPRRMIQLLDG